MCSFVVGNSTKQFSSITENQNRELLLTDPGPAVESELSSQYVTHSDNMSMFIAPVAMLSAQSHSVNWMVDSGAGMSGTSTKVGIVKCGKKLFLDLLFTNENVPITYVIQCHVAFLSHQRSDQH